MRERERTIGAAEDGLGRLGLLASALSGRALRVATGARGELAWTDGTTIFLDADTSARNRLEALAVQASLLAAGSLEPDIVRSLTRRPARARRYLAVEGHRALAANQHLLPHRVRSLIDGEVAALGDSPGESLAVALGRETIADPPENFGEIRARRLLAATARADASATGRDRALQQQRDPLLVELEDGEADEAGAAIDFSSPVGGGPLGRWLQPMLRMVRSLEVGGNPGVDAPTHRARTGAGGARAAFATGIAGTVEQAAAGKRGVQYPEWDVHRQAYRPAWCTVHEVEPTTTERAPLAVSDRYGLRRSLARLGTGLESCHRQVLGDDIDIDAAVEARVELMAGSVPDESVYIDSLRRRRDLAVLLLLDISGSVAEPGATARTVHEEQRTAAAALTAALRDLGDRVALYAFQSRGRSAVHFVPVKRFDEELDALVMRRLHGLVPGAYSRLGAAIRHAASVLEQRGGTSRRLLLVLSDGLAYDHSYERDYGSADARHALAEARGRGTACVCLTIGASIEVEALRRVFGSAAHASIPSAEQLHKVVGPLFRSALRSAEVRRR